MSSGKKTSPSHFKPGQSGNPRGRPKVDFDLRDLCREHTYAAIDTLVEIMGNKRIDPFSRTAAAKEILVRGYGKAPQSIALTGGEGEHGESLPIEIKTMSDLELTNKVKAILEKGQK